MEKPSVRVGIGVFVFKNGKFLIQKRKGSHGEGSWALPGGGLEFGESFEDAARREVMEEANIDIKNIRFGAVTNDHFIDENKHYVTIWMVSEWADGEARIMEPEKCTAQAWSTFDNLPEPPFSAWKQLLKSDFIKDIRAQLAQTSRAN